MNQIVSGPPTPLEHLTWQPNQCRQVCALAPVRVEEVRQMKRQTTERVRDAPAANVRAPSPDVPQESVKPRGRRVPAGRGNQVLNERRQQS